MSNAHRRGVVAPWRQGEVRLAWQLVFPTLMMLALTALVPIGWTTWESFHLHDLRMPWLGRPLTGMANYVEALTDRRFSDAAVHTAVFAGVAVTLEMCGGLMLALGLERITRGVRLIRTAILLPWAVPTVVAALVWRFIFESPGGMASTTIQHLGVTAPTWLADPVAAWVPLVLADVWKTMPFVALLLIAGLQNIDPQLYEAASIDGAGAWRQFLDVTLPLLRPALTVAFLFRLLDAFRVFDIVYVLTSGGPGTATEPVAVYAFIALMQSLRFGYGSALSMIVFGVSFAVALVAVRLLSPEPQRSAS
jgi:ABC-type sugar transport system permease subunit